MQAHGLRAARPVSFHVLAGPRLARHCSCYSTRRNYSSSQFVTRTFAHNNFFAMSSAIPERPKPAQGKADKPAKKDKKADAAKAGRSNELDPPPAYIAHRIELFDRLKKEYDEELAKKPRENINVTLPDGRIEVGQSWETTPAQIAGNLSKSLLERTVISKVDGELWDLERPLEKSCKLELLPFDDPSGEAKKVFWHSSAHILGEASERMYGCDLCIGPPVDDGFYYEMALPDGGVVQSTDWKGLESIAQKAIKEKQPFVRLELSKENLLEMFKSNKYKQHIIKDKIADGSKTTVYRCGPLIDLCRGPHVPHTGRIKAFQIMKNSASYFLGDANNDSLQRIYGVSFPDKKQMDEHLKFLEEAAKRDHRKIGTQQELFFFNDMSPGAAFFMPHGTIIYNTLLSFLREEYWKRGYQEVVTPNMYSSDLWKRSGHWQHYHEDMFTFDVEKDKWALKPMNCPGHALVFGHRNRTYKELPIRMAEFGILHRNEASGALSGLTRVRRFQQDDTHIFCAEDQVKGEIAALFDFLKTVYGNFGFAFKMLLSTRPETYLGEIETWDRAEAQLQGALEDFAREGGAQWELNPGDGAFYGPKIDIMISDALKRWFQCATIQLDFQLPQQFNLEYQTADMGNAGTPTAPNGEASKPPVAAADPPTSIPDPSVTPATPAAPAAPGDAAAAKTAQEKDYRKPLTPGCARPVMIHRAICGSFERFIAILTEHFGGKWPFWLSPRQIMVIPVMPSANDYVAEVTQLFRAKGFHADSDISGNTMPKKIRSAQLAQYNFIFVVGAQEKESKTVNIRDRDDPATQAKGEMITLDDAMKKMEELRATRALPRMVSPLGATEGGAA